ncbi:MAG TPA: hypothetical protein VLH13_03825, partial [Methanomassiliicoccales archaeon]|nr:hypothetical protein [Methanomassiliicoccales archaeon]
INLEMIKNGLMAGIPVAVVCGIIIFALGSTIYSEAIALGEVGTKNDILGNWMFRWAAISLVFGVLATAAYSFLRTNISMGPLGFLVLAIAMATVLTVMEFVPIYGDKKFAPYWETYALFNYAYAIGFGSLIPRLMGN